MMRSYMARPCDMYFTLDKKINCFISSAFDMFHVPLDEQEKVKNIIEKMDFIALIQKVMNSLFMQLEMAFDFKFDKDVKV